MFSLSVSVTPVFTIEVSVPTIFYGTRANIRGTFALDGSPTDPTSLRLSLIKPDGTIVVTTSLENPDTGVFQYEVLFDQVGSWRYRFESYGEDEESAVEGIVTVPRRLA